MFKVSRWTIARWVDDYNLDSLSRYNNMRNDELGQVIWDYISTHGPAIGQPLMSGYLKLKGYRVQPQRVRSSLNRVDPKKQSFTLGSSSI